MPVPIAIFENNEAYRNSLQLFFDEYPEIDLRASFTEGSDAAGKIHGLGLKLVLMDIDMPWTNGIDATRVIKQAFPDVQVLILTVFDDNERVFDAICAGADGYILKSSTPHDIVRAIKDTLNGGSPMTASVARKVLSLFARQEHSTKPSSQLSPLTDKEQQVLARLVEGDSYKMIADKLGISIDTVRFHIRHIYGKLHVNSATEAVSLALRKKLL